MVRLPHRCSQLNQILSRTKPAELAEEVGPSPSHQKKKKLPKLGDFLARRDYTGAMTLLEVGVRRCHVFNGVQFLQSTGQPNEKSEEWIAYCAFHLGDYAKALSVYKKLLENPHADPELWTFLGCCCFFLGMYKEADAASMKGTPGSLQTRLLFHLSHKARRHVAGAHTIVQRRKTVDEFSPETPRCY